MFLRDVTSLGDCRIVIHVTVTKDVTSHNFGLLIAYLLPGFVALWGVSFFSEAVQTWLSSTARQAPTLGGFLYGTIGSVAMGLTVSTIRWLVIDNIHHRTGITRPKRNYARLQENVEAFQLLVGNQYRYYQFYALWRHLHKLYYVDLSVMRSLPWQRD